MNDDPIERRFLQGVVNPQPFEYSLKPRPSNDTNQIERRSIETTNRVELLFPILGITFVSRTNQTKDRTKDSRFSLTSTKASNHRRILTFGLDILDLRMS